MCSVLSHLVATIVGGLAVFIITRWFARRLEEVPEEQIQVLKRLSNASQGCLPQWNIRDTLKSYELPKGKVDSTIRKLEECGEIRYEDRGPPWNHWCCITDTGRVVLEKGERRSVKRGTKDSGERP